MEYLDLYDDNKVNTGIRVERGYTCKEGEHLMVVHLCIFNEEGKLLIQRRSLEKSMFPGVWDLSAGGHVASGETSVEAVMRETTEEIGFSDFCGMRFSFMEPFSYVFDDFYAIIRDVDLDSLTLQTSEICEVKWASKEEVFAMSKEGTFVNYEHSCLEKIFDSFYDVVCVYPVQDLEQSALKIFHSMSERQLARINEPEEGIFIAETSMVIGTALDHGYEPVCLLVDEDELYGQAFSAVRRCQKVNPDILIHAASNALLTKITGFKLTRGILCAMMRKKNPDYEEVIAGCHRIVVLEDVMNPTNMGAIFRSAAALGMDAILLSSGCTDPLYRRCIRVSMGTVFQIPWTYIYGDVNEKLHASGYKTVAMALKEDSYRIGDEKLHQEEKLAVFMGTEGTGLKNDTIDACDYAVMIPMAHGVDSLNVAAASSVAFWELGKCEGRE